MKNLYKIFEKILILKNTDEFLKNQKSLHEYIIYEVDDYVWIDISNIKIDPD